jgi:flagellar protein FlaD
MITELEIDNKLKKLQGKVPTVLINDLREKLIAKMDLLEPEQVDRIIEKVMEKYASQVDRLIKLDKRIEEIGKHLEELSKNLLQEKKEQWIKNQVIQENAKAVEKISNEYLHASETSLDGGYAANSVNESLMEETPMEEQLNIPKDIGLILFDRSSKKYRLEKLPDDMISTMTALKWLGFLMERVGVQNLENVLEYYYELGWISEEVLNDLLKYAKGTKPYHREPDWKPADKLTIQDHVISLLFIERLRGTRVSREILDILEREMKLITKAIEEFYGV